MRDADLSRPNRDRRHETRRRCSGASAIASAAGTHRRNSDAGSRAGVCRRSPASARRHRSRTQRPTLEPAVRCRRCGPARCRHARASVGWPRSWCPVGTRRGADSTVSTTRSTTLRRTSPGSVLMVVAAARFGHTAVPMWGSYAPRAGCCRAERAFSPVSIMLRVLGLRHGRRK